eukprot:gnl/MRDRNA2_/MRDRNA2_99885_c0_seq1.p1 gnl/MRDRNA2_/MRDRNA2_99885_c0~~gnl/MRDRNA2_/MRDRNA2_99885_c0_seq1.p1  ORF type:complete len:922 (-),score=194.46 gnl/MRDRNA2_/MRDRNA2_99885_c0_seq1:471-3236(-)
MISRRYIPPRPTSQRPLQNSSWLPPLPASKSGGESFGSMTRPMSAPSLDNHQVSRQSRSQTTASQRYHRGSHISSQERSRPSTATGFEPLHAVKRRNVKDLRKGLDAMTAPSMMDLRLNNQNVRKKLQQNGFANVKPFKIPPLERLRMEIRTLFQGQEWEFLETIQVVEFRDALEQKCAVPSGTFRNNTFMKLLSEEVERHRSALTRARRSADANDAMLRQTVVTDAPATVIDTALQEDEVATDSQGVPIIPESHQQTPQDVSKRQQEKPKDCEALWASTFKRLSHDFEIHADELPRALELIGIPKPDINWIDEVKTAISRYSTLSLSEFSVFVRNYRKRQSEHFREKFQEYDVDGSGAVDKTELRDLLNRVGITPLPAVLEQVIDEVDDDGSGCVGFDEFEKVMEIMRVREGFTKNEVAEFDHAFKKFDLDMSGEIDTNELLGILGWLGYSQNKEAVNEVVSKVDFDGSGSVSREEFLVCMRQLRQKEVDHVRAIMASCDEDGSGTINSKELHGLLKALGYNLSPDVLREVCADAGCENKTEMTFEDIWTMISLFRMREGFLRSEVEDLQEAFDKYDKHGRSELDCIDLGHVLRWLGYSPSLQEQQMLVAEVDVDKSGLLDLSEFMKLMRKKREASLFKMRNAFCTFEKNTNDDVVGTGHLKHSEGSVLRALRLIGIFKIPRDFAQGQPSYSNEVDFESFVKMVKRCHEIDRNVFRQNAGFSDAMVSDYKKKFEVYDADRSGDISNRELQRLLLDLYPADATSKDARPKLQKLMQAVDDDQNGRLDFGDFLRLNRQYQTELENDRILKEQIAIEETGIEASEVEGYRSLFQQESGHTKESSLNFSHIHRMMSGIVSLGAKHNEELQAIIGSIGGSDGKVDFPEFLRIIKQVQDLNLANINEKAAELSMNEKGVEHSVSSE